MKSRRFSEQPFFRHTPTDVFPTFPPAIFAFLFSGRPLSSCRVNGDHSINPKIQTPDSFATCAGLNVSAAVREMNILRESIPLRSDARAPVFHVCMCVK